MKTLIVYFSRTGHTERVAKQISRTMNATLMPISEARSRLGCLGYQRCLIEAAFGLDAKVLPSSTDPADYDLVLLGTPIWAWHLSSPVRTFARRHGKAIRQCGFFCTMGGSGHKAAFSELEKLIGHSPLVTLALTDKDVDAGQGRKRIASFSAKLKASVAQGRKQ